MRNNCTASRARRAVHCGRAVHARSIKRGVWCSALARRHHAPLVCAAPTLCSHTRTLQTRATVTKAREAYQRKLDAAAALEAAAARKAAKEEADKKAEAERLAGLDRETRRKVEEKNRKKAVAAATQPRKKMVRA
ncbi:MAG: DUF1682 domain-containing protein [Methanobacteriota archaeon]|nr:MAG: DUF1682 domain-containing protein [Euryarchaeota archaeon]